MKSTVKTYERVDISKYGRLFAFLKRQNDEYHVKKSRVLSMKNIVDFFNNASDINYLFMKVVVLFSLHGALRRGELWNLKVDDINDTGSILIVTVTETKNKKDRIFTITSDLDGYNLYQKYVCLRPKNVTHRKLFVFYKEGKCTVQAVGINTFGAIPKKIAAFLMLDNPSLYTGYCLRRTSATLLADSGADTLKLKRHGGWRSSNVAESYVEESISNKIKISKEIFQEAATIPSKNNDAAYHSIDMKKDTSEELLALKPVTCMNNEVTSVPKSVSVESTMVQNAILEDNVDKTKCVSIVSSNFNNCIFNISNNH